MMADIVYGYVRVSSEKQEKGFGPEVQADAIKKYCIDNRLPEAQIRYEAETGKNKEREVLKSIYTDAKKNSDVNDKPHCIIFKMDRLARISVDIDGFIVQAHAIGLRLHSCQASEEQFFDPYSVKSPGIKMLRQVMSAFIEYERDLIQMRLDGGLEKLNARGGYTGGGVPFGYKIVNKDLAIEEKLKPVIRDIFRCVDAGDTLEDVVAQMQTTYPGMMKWSTQTIHKIVKRRRMYMEGIYRGRLGGETKRPELIMINEKDIQ